MSDDEADPELLDLLRQSLGQAPATAKPPPPETRVLEGAQYVFDNAIDVALDPTRTREAAETIWRLMQEKEFSTQTWSKHELHPKTKDESAVEFIFVMDLLNFSFWSGEADVERRFAVDYRGRKWTGYWALVAALRRALDEGIPITSPEYWADHDQCTDEVLKHVFRSATDEGIPLFEERVQCLREAGIVLCEKFDGTFTNCIYDANHSAAGLVNLLAENFSCFRDEAVFHGKRVRLYKRAQILVADIWACFNGQGYGEFSDIDKITMFADYRIPQILYHLGCLRYSPPLESHIRQLKPLPSGSTWEVEIRGTTIWCIELIKREIERRHPEAKVAKPHSQSQSQPQHSHHASVSNGNSLGNGTINGNGTTNGNGTNGTSNGNANCNGNGVGDLESPATTATTTAAATGLNAILIDFFLYDTMKSLEKQNLEVIPHHRTRSIWY